ncbi:hypothetical protein [Variovorax sp. W2I14]|uniref:hypothetical protein n=1 Tax=Variovorax sp. W2I14 TaxID=3042290 RepID=UPI003D25968B
MRFDREQVAKAYQTALRVSRAQFFETNASLPVSLTDSAHTPYLGWVGKNYRGGTVLIAKNPGGGGDSQVETTALDASVIARLKALRDSEGDHATLLLDELTDAYHSQLPTIGMGVLLNRVLSRAGETLDSVAFFNACPYRTRNDEKLGARTQKKSRELVAAPLLEALCPDTIIYLGVEVGREASKTLNARWTYVLPRAINDKQINKDAEPVLAQIEGDTPARLVYRGSHG